MVPLPDSELAPYEAEIETRLGCLREELGGACLSDYSFYNIYLFRQIHVYRYSPGPLPCIDGVTYDGYRHLLPLFDPRLHDQSALLDRLGGHDFYFPIAETLLGGFDRQYFDISALPADADYLYPASNFRDYPGPGLRKKRALMAGLLARHAVETRHLDHSSRSAARLVLDTWMREKGKQAGEADQAPCLEALNNPARFALEGLVHYADGVPAGFLLAQILTDKVCVIRFAKGVSAYNGIYQYMFSHFCKLHEKDISWINFEQDLGLANFRKTKLSYRPSRLLSKFRAAARTGA